MQPPQAGGRQAHLAESDAQRQRHHQRCRRRRGGYAGRLVDDGTERASSPSVLWLQAPPAEGVVNEGGVNMPPSDDAFKRFTEHHAGVRASGSGGDAARLYPAADGLQAARSDNTMRYGTDGGEGIAICREPSLLLLPITGE